MESKFAKSQLTKHGWKDGSGLGRHESGIKEAIKVNIKHDTKGVGHDAGEQFTFHWWDHVFNKAASNITVETSEDGVAVTKSTETGVIHARKRKTYDNKSMLYGQFIKGATLSGEGYKPEENSAAGESEEEDEKPSKSYIIPANEDEIFRQCGGRTAHKAARHGHKLNGKLARIQQQEQMLLEKMKSASSNQKTEKSSLQKTEESSEAMGTDVNVIEETVSSKKKKKKRKKERKEREPSCDADENEDGKSEELDQNIVLDSENLSDDKIVKKGKKRKKKREILEDYKEYSHVVLGKNKKSEENSISERKDDSVEMIANADIVIEQENDVDNCNQENKKNKRKKNKKEKTVD